MSKDIGMGVRKGTVVSFIPTLFGYFLGIPSLYVFSFFKMFFCDFKSITVTLSTPGATRGTARVQDGVLTCYMDAAFVLLAHKGSELWTNQSILFTQIGLLQLQHD